MPSLATVLDAIDDGADLFSERSWSDWAVAALLPTPQMDYVDINPDATLTRCRESWADPQEFTTLIDRWLTIAKGQPTAADAVTKFARTAPVAWQTSNGLDWLESIIDRRYSDFSNRTRSVTNWLRDLRSSGAVTALDVPRFRRIIDGLAASGDHDAVTLQLLEE